MQSQTGTSRGLPWQSDYEGSMLPAQRTSMEMRSVPGQRTRTPLVVVAWPEVKKGGGAWGWGFHLEKTKRNLLLVRRSFWIKSHKKSPYQDQHLCSCFLSSEVCCDSRQETGQPRQSWAIHRKEMNQASAFLPAGPWSTAQDGVSPAVERNESKAGGNLAWHEPCNPEEPG